MLLSLNPIINNSSRIAVVRKKLYEIGEILKYTNIEYGLQATGIGNESTLSYFSKLHTWNLGEEQAIAIESVLKNELNFLYFLNWNTLVFSKDKRVKENDKKIQIIKHNLSSIPDLKMLEDMEELAKLGSPRQRLIEIVKQNKDIQEFFSRYLNDIINYRKKSLDNMAKLYMDVSTLQDIPCPEKSTI